MYTLWIARTFLNVPLDRWLILVLSQFADALCNWTLIWSQLTNAMTCYWHILNSWVGGWKKRLWPVCSRRTVIILYNQSRHIWYLMVLSRDCNTSAVILQTNGAMNKALQMQSQKTVEWRFRRLLSIYYYKQFFLHTCVLKLYTRIIGCFSPFIPRMCVTKMSFYLLSRWIITEWMTHQSVTSQDQHLSSQ